MVRKEIGILMNTLFVARLSMAVEHKTYKSEKKPTKRSGQAVICIKGVGLKPKREQ